MGIYYCLRPALLFPCIFFLPKIWQYEMTIQNQPEADPPQQVNLQEIVRQFMARLQNHFDMLAFNLASREVVSEDGYKHHSNAPSIMPLASHHQNFEQIQAHARDLMVQKVIGDALNLAGSALHNAHFFLALVKATQGETTVSPEARHKAEKSQKDFLGAELEVKFRRLKEDYGITCDLKDILDSFVSCINAFVRQRGEVQKDQLDANGELVLRLKAIESKPPKARMTERCKVFREGEFIELNDLELQLVFVSIASFAKSLFNSVTEYAKSVQRK